MLKYTLSKNFRESPYRDCAIQRELHPKCPTMNSSRYPFPPRIFRLVSRAMSPLANFSHMSTTIVKLHRVPREKEKEREKRLRSDCFGRRRRRRRPYATALSLLHPRNESPLPRRDHTTEGCESRINTRRRHPLMETCERTTLECLASTSFAYPSCHPYLDERTHASRNHRHMFVPYSTLLAEGTVHSRDNRISGWSADRSECRRAQTLSQKMLKIFNELKKVRLPLYRNYGRNGYL